MTKRPAKKPQLSTAAAAVRYYGDAVKMLARQEGTKRFHSAPYGRKRRPRARKMVMLELFPMEWATFLGLMAVGSVRNGTRTKAQILALIEASNTLSDVMGKLGITEPDPDDD